MRKSRSTNLRESLSQAEHRNDISGGARTQNFFFPFPSRSRRRVCLHKLPMAKPIGSRCAGLVGKPAVRRRCNCLFKVKPTCSTLFRVLVVRAFSKHSRGHSADRKADFSCDSPLSTRGKRRFRSREKNNELESRGDGRRVVIQRRLDIFFKHATIPFQITSDINGDFTSGELHVFARGLFGDYSFKKNQELAK